MPEELRDGLEILSRRIRRSESSAAAREMVESWELDVEELARETFRRQAHRKDSTDRVLSAVADALYGLEPGQPPHVRLMS